MVENMFYMSPHHIGYFFGTAVIIIIKVLPNCSCTYKMFQELPLTLVLVSVLTHFNVTLKGKLANCKPRSEATEHSI